MDRVRNLSDSSLELQVVLQAFPDLYFRLDSQGVFVDYHAATRSDPDLSSEFFIGKSFRDVLPKPVARNLESALKKVDELRSTVVFEYLIEHHGETHSFEARVVHVFEDEYLVVAREITERKNAEEALRVANERFELASAAVNSAIYDWDIKLELVTWSKGLSRVFGYPIEMEHTTTDQWWIERIHPEDRKKVVEEISLDVSRARNFAIEYRFRTSDDQYRVVLDRGLLVRNTEDVVIRVVGSLIDITAPKEVEEQLRESEQQYRFLFENNPSPMWVYDLDSLRFLAVNQAAIRQYGYTNEEFLRIDMTEIRPSEDVPQYLEYVQKVRTETKEVRDSGFWRHRKKDGAIVDVETFSQKLKFQGRIARLVLANDVTERRHAQEILKLLIEVTTDSSEAEDVRDMTSKCLEKICSLRGWQIGQAWFIDEATNTLFCSHSFYSEMDATEVRHDSLRRRFPAGTGLPGRVWDTQEPLWISDLLIGPVLPRSESLLRSGLRTAFAFPITVEGSVVAIFEFFARESRPPDSIFLEAVKRLGPHLGLVFSRKREQEKIRYQATHDVLTGLPNRILFHDRFTQALAHASRKSQILAMLMLDLDNFKKINDTLGHAVGDLLLQSVAQRLSKSMREVDTIARMGGDEVVVLLSDVRQIEDVAKVAQKIFSVLQQPFQIEQHKLHITTSIGISIFPHDGENAQTLLKNADIALYRAKEKGRNNYQLYTPSMTAAALTRLTLENHLRHALEEDQFVIYYQPEIEISTGSIVAVEALLRWQHPEMGLCLPAEFMTIAEETGLIGLIWEWALRTACAQGKVWQNAGIAPFLIAMNIPAFQIRQHDILPTISETLSSTQLDPRFLELEITEVVTKKELGNIGLLQEIRRMGIGICLDDFGTGYSSLGYLKEFPINALKIDPYFVRGLNTDPNDVAITRAIIALGHGLNMRVIAEGVETKEQLITLRSLGCDAFQGFLITRPLPVDHITPMLAAGIKLPL